MALAREDASPPVYALGAFEIRRYQSQLWWIKSVTGQKRNHCAVADVATTAGITGGTGKCTAYCGEAIFALRVRDEAVSVRFKAPGLLHIIGRNGGRKLKKIWQELGVPPWLRDTTPLLFYGETLIAAAGVFMTQEGMAESENGVSFVWQRNG